MITTRSADPRVGLVVASAVLLGAGQAAWGAPARYRLDPEHLSIGFLVRHIGYADLLGQFLQAEGGFTFDEEARTVSVGDEVEIIIEPEAIREPS